MTVFHKILVPLDASDLADRVLDTALATAAWSGAELYLLRVQSEPVSLDPGDADIDLNVIEQEVDELFARAAERGDSGPMPSRDKIHAEVRSGSVVDAIGSAVEELMCDLVIMGTHGRSGVLERLTGSTTEQALRKVPASVFIVRPHGYPYLTD